LYKNRDATVRCSMLHADWGGRSGLFGSFTGYGMCNYTLEWTDYRRQEDGNGNILARWLDTVHTYPMHDTEIQATMQLMAVRKFKDFFDDYKHINQESGFYWSPDQWWYDSGSDMMYTAPMGSGGDLIYCGGTWADRRLKRLLLEGDYRPNMINTWESEEEVINQLLPNQF
jgi:hypothetical protein